MNLVIGDTYWIDVCQSNANLLASCGTDRIIRIFDKRESKIVKTFEDIHSGKEFNSILLLFRYWGFVCCLVWSNFPFTHLVLIIDLKIIVETIFCVRWSQNGDMIASSSSDKTAKLLDFKTGKVLYTGTTSDESKRLMTNNNYIY